MRFMVMMLMAFAFIGMVQVDGLDIGQLLGSAGPLLRMAKCALPTIKRNLGGAGFKIGDFNQLFKESAPGLKKCRINPQQQLQFKEVLIQFFGPQTNANQ